MVAITDTENPWNAPSTPQELPDLLRGETSVLTSWLDGPMLRRIGFHVLVIVLGAGVYGAVIGWWRSPLQGLFTAIKFPMILLLTTIGNALVNSMLAPLLGLKIGFRQTFLAVLMSFTIVALILGSFAPMVLFMIWNVPALSSASAKIPSVYLFIMLSQVVVVAFAGLAGNVRLYQLLRKLAGSRITALKILFSWLGTNFLLGTQLTWILRPFFGSPHLEVQFLRSNAFESNFYETIFYSIKSLIS